MDISIAETAQTAYSVSMDFQNHSEPLGTFPHTSESFRSVPQHSERTEHHTLTAREVTRIFEQAGVARTERSVINWCHPDKHGVSRLDCWYDTNARKFFITPQSVELAVKEEQSKVGAGAKPSETFSNPSQPAASQPQGAPTPPPPLTDDQRRQFRAKVRRLELEAEVSKRYIERLETERQKFLETMMGQSKQIGVLETKLLQLEAPRHAPYTPTPEARPVTYTETAASPHDADDAHTYHFQPDTHI